MKGRYENNGYFCVCGAHATRYTNASRYAGLARAVDAERHHLDARFWLRPPRVCACRFQSSLLNCSRCSALNREIHAHAIVQRVNLNARRSSSALRNTVTTRALDFAFLYGPRNAPLSASALLTIRHFSRAPNTPRCAHSTRRVRHWSAVHNTAATHRVAHRSAQCVDSGCNPTSHRLRKGNARRSPGRDRMFARRRKPLRTAFTLGHNKRTENKGWQDRLPPVLGATCNANASLSSSRCGPLIRRSQAANRLPVAGVRVSCSDRHSCGR